MIEAIDVGPGLHRMAGFATEGRAIGPLFRHAVVEFALMRILMAPGAGLILKFERQDLIRAPGCAELVAIAAGYRGVGAGEREFRVAVLCNRVRRAVPVHDGVAVFAAVLVGGARKLVVVRILVAIHAEFELDVVDRVLARRKVTLRTFHLDVFAFQGVARVVVLFHAKSRRLPPVDVVTLFTGAFPRAVVKLPLVRIGRVAVLASLKRNLFLEVIIQMAGLADHLGVLAEQGVLGLGVIKVIGWKHDLPSVGCMAGLARFFEFAAVWIDVAVDAVGKLHVLVPYRPARCIGLVALIAGHLAVQSGQRIPRLRVIKLAFLAHLPGFHVVALSALAPERSFVRIGMARSASRRLPEKGFGGILVFDQRPQVGKHVLGRVTFLASYTRVFAFQSVAG